MASKRIGIEELRVQSQIDLLIGRIARDEPLLGQIKEFDKPFQELIQAIDGALLRARSGDGSKKTWTPSDPTELPQKAIFSVKLASILDQYPDSPLAKVYLKEAESAGEDPRAVYDQAVRMLKGGTRRSLPTFEALTSASASEGSSKTQFGRHGQEIHPGKASWIARMVRELPKRFHEHLGNAWDRITARPVIGHLKSGPSEPSDEETFITQNAGTLVQNLAYDCASAAKDICKALRDLLPPGANEDSIFLVILSLRASIELRGVGREFGRRAFDVLLAAMDDDYSRPMGKQPGWFISVIAVAEETIEQEQNPREWMRRHSMNLLKTRDPQDEAFHASLAYAFTLGEPIAALVKRECRGNAAAGKKGTPGSSP